MKAAVYLRVSTDRQDEANQEPDTLRLCAARGWTPAVYREVESGARRRPEWDSVLEAARRGQVGAVVFWSIDRIGRTKVQAAHDLRELFRWNVTVVSAQERWLDCPPEQGRFRDLLVDIVTWFAEGERQRLIERTRAGLARARREGRTLGRPRVPVAPWALAAARGAREGGASWRTVAELVGLRPTTLRRALATKDVGSTSPKTTRRGGIGGV